MMIALLVTAVLWAGLWGWTRREYGEDYGPSLLVLLATVATGAFWLGVAVRAFL